MNEDLWPGRVVQTHYNMSVPNQIIVCLFSVPLSESLVPIILLYYLKSYQDNNTF